MNSKTFYPFNPFEVKHRAAKLSKMLAIVNAMPNDDLRNLLLTDNQSIEVSGVWRDLEAAAGVNPTSPDTRRALQLILNEPR